MNLNLNVNTAMMHNLGVLVVASVNIMLTDGNSYIVAWPVEAKLKLKHFLDAVITSRLSLKAALIQYIQHSPVSFRKSLPVFVWMPCFPFCFLLIQAFELTFGCYHG